WLLVTEAGARHEGVATVDTLAPADDAHGPAARGRLRLRIPATLPLGYHEVRVEAPDGAATMALIVAPRRCHFPPNLAAGARLWGVAAQLYSVRSAADWGIGDFSTLRGLVELAASRGAAIVGLNPLHAMFLDRPAHSSLYSPASRLFLNILYI